MPVIQQAAPQGNFTWVPIDSARTGEDIRANGYTSRHSGQGEPP